MTLNIAATSRNGVYLTGDFRITYSGLFHFWHKDDLNIQKLVPIGKLDWIGLVSFCGIATRFGSRVDVGEWILEQTRPEILDESIDEVIHRLRSADEWLARARGYRNLSITLVGFQGRRPFIRLLSNYQDLDGQKIETQSTDLRLFETADRSPVVRFFGDPRAVKEEYRQRLLALLTRNAHGEIVQALADINARGNTHCPTVSSESLVGFLQPSGDGGVNAYISEEPIYFPDWAKRMVRAQNIIGFEERADSSGKPLKPSVVGITLKSEGAKTKQARFSAMLRIRNAGNPIMGVASANKTRPNMAGFYKFSEEDEPDTLNWSGGSIRIPKPIKPSER